MYYILKIFYKLEISLKSYFGFENSSVKTPSSLGWKNLNNKSIYHHCFRYEIFKLLFEGSGIKLTKTIFENRNKFTQKSINSSVMFSLKSSKIMHICGICNDLHIPANLWKRMYWNRVLKVRSSYNHIKTRSYIPVERVNRCMISSNEMPVLKMSTEKTEKKSTLSLTCSKTNIQKTRVKGKREIYPTLKLKQQMISHFSNTVSSVC